MRSSLRAAAAAIAALQTGILVAGQDQTEIKTYSTDVPEEVTTVLTTVCPCEGTPVPYPWPCEDGEDCTPDEYPPDQYPPETITITETETYTEPGQTIKKTKYKTRTETQYATQTVHEPFNVTYTTTSTQYKPTTYYETIINNQTITDTATSTATVTDIYVSETTSISYVTYPASTVTENGTTVIIPPQTLTTTVTERETIPITIDRPVPYATTVIETVISGTTSFITQTLDRPVPYPTTVIETVVSGTTSFITQTLDRPVPSPTTVFETVISGTTSLVTQTLDRTQLVTVVSDRLVPTTIVQPPSTFTTTISLPGTTFITTITESGTTVVSTITQPGTVSTQIITQFGRTFVDTITIVQTGPTIVRTEPAQVISAPPQIVTVEVPPVTVTATPEPPVCSETGLVAVADSAGCGGRNCQIEYQEGAAVHWVDFPLSVAPPLRTAITFINEASRQTCITTSCNTDAFNEYYRTSLGACARPPCPSNTIDCDCNIVVGPIGLPGGQTTSVTQIGSSGWNLNLGPTATARDVGRCSAGGPECVTEAPRTLFTPVVYTGEVSNITVTNAAGSIAVNYLLPGIGDYFPPGDPLGDCTTAVLNSVSGYAPMLRARQVDGGFNSKLVTWKGAPTFAGQQIIRVSAEAVSLPSTPASVLAETTPAQSEPNASVASPTPESTPQSPTDAIVTTQSEGSGSTQTTVDPQQPESPTQSSGDSSVNVTPGTTATGGPNSVPATSPSESDGTAVESSVVLGTDSSSVSGTIYYTNTVYYSMVQGPAGQDVLDAVSMIRAGASTVASSDFGAYVTSILGLNSTGVPADVSESASTTNSSAPAQNTTGAAPGQVAVSWTLVMAACFFTISLLV
ncbi:hypothetical protein Slin15195_G040350 [Septoria linicola]|uniref:Uncharacterized protein n=1 Tax=Septoria linicola TaxID=215465 RepID=A0A9Q9EGD8_9PEZI|nr:hypothetical protein Slin14017_G043880 [Septoria linicola]USW50716.1 hypothetical protein Slin15195_G040350 [Septoria linicola]